jgi:hypothetical protein
MVVSHILHIYRLNHHTHTRRGMSAGVFGLDLLLTAVVVLYLLNRYGNIRKAPWTCAMVFLTWYICFSILFVLPMDVSAVRHIRSDLMIDVIGAQPLT